MHNRLYGSLVLLFLFCSCSDRLYFPDRANVPAFRNAGDLNVNVSAKLQANGKSVLSPAADVAYAPADHFGIIASYRGLVNRYGYLYPTYGKPSNYSATNTEVLLNGYRIEGGPGYFTGFGGSGIFETFAGVGKGQLTGSGNNPVTDKIFSSSYNRLFLQSEVGLRNRYVSVMAGIRLADQQYGHFVSADSTLRYNIDKSVTTSDPNDFTRHPFLFIEPFFNFEAGTHWLYFNYQMGVTAQTGVRASIISDVPVFVSLGLSIRWPSSVAGGKASSKKHRNQ